MPEPSVSRIGMHLRSGVAGQIRSDPDAQKNALVAVGDGTPRGTCTSGPAPSFLFQPFGPISARTTESHFCDALSRSPKRDRPRARCESCSGCRSLVADLVAAFAESLKGPGETVRG